MLVCRTPKPKVVMRSAAAFWLVPAWQAFNLESLLRVAVERLARLARASENAEECCVPSAPAANARMPV
jgi:hypothetical protein